MFGITVEEVESRCCGMVKEKYPCRHLLMKLKKVTGFSGPLLRLLEEKKIELSVLREGIEVKLAIETICRNCKTKDTKVIVL